MGALTVMTTVFPAGMVGGAAVCDQTTLPSRSKTSAAKVAVWAVVYSLETSPSKVAVALLASVSMPVA